MSASPRPTKPVGDDDTVVPVAPPTDADEVLFRLALAGCCDQITVDALARAGVRDPEFVHRGTRRWAPRALIRFATHGVRTVEDLDAHTDAQIRPPAVEVLHRCGVTDPADQRRICGEVIDANALARWEHCVSVTDLDLIVAAARRRLNPTSVAVLVFYGFTDIDDLARLIAGGVNGFWLETALSAGARTVDEIIAAHRSTHPDLAGLRSR